VRRLTKPRRKPTLGSPAEFATEPPEPLFRTAGHAVSTPSRILAI